MKSRALSIDSIDEDNALNVLPFHRVRRRFSQRIPTHDDEDGSGSQGGLSRPTLASELNVGTIAPYLMSSNDHQVRPLTIYSSAGGSGRNSAGGVSAPGSKGLSEHEERDHQIERGLTDMLLTGAGPSSSLSGAAAAPGYSSLRPRNLRQELTDDDGQNFNKMLLNNDDEANAPWNRALGAEDDSLSLLSFSGTEDEDEPPSIARATNRRMAPSSTGAGLRMGNLYHCITTKTVSQSLSIHNMTTTQINLPIIYPSLPPPIPPPIR